MYSQKLVSLTHSNGTSLWLSSSDSHTISKFSFHNIFTILSFTKNATLLNTTWRYVTVHHLLGRWQMLTELFLNYQWNDLDVWRIKNIIHGNMLKVLEVMSGFTSVSLIIKITAENKWLHTELISWFTANSLVNCHNHKARLRIVCHQVLHTTDVMKNGERDEAHYNGAMVPGKVSKR